MIKDMQSKLTLSHTDLNRMFKEQVTRQNKLEDNFEKIVDKNASLDNVNTMLNERTTQHAKSLEQLRTITDHLKETK